MGRSRGRHDGLGAIFLRRAPSGRNLPRPAAPGPGEQVTTCFDDPADRVAILVGMYLWERYGRYGVPLTEEMLLEALTQYEQDLVWGE